MHPTPWQAFVRSWCGADVERLGMDELFVDLTDLVDQRMAALGEGQRRTLVHPSGFVYPASRAATQADGMFMTSDGPCLDTPCGACGSPPVVATNSDVGLAEAAASPR